MLGSVILIAYGVVAITSSLLTLGVQYIWRKIRKRREVKPHA